MPSHSKRKGKSSKQNQTSTIDKQRDRELIESLKNAQLEFERYLSTSEVLDQLGEKINSLQKSLENCLHKLPVLLAVEEYEKIFQYIKKFNFETLHTLPYAKKFNDVVNEKSVIIIYELGSLISNAGWVFIEKLSLDKPQLINDILNIVTNTMLLSEDVCLELAILIFRQFIMLLDTELTNSEREKFINHINTLLEKAESVIQDFFIKQSKFTTNEAAIWRFNQALFCNYQTKASLQLSCNNLTLATEFKNKCASILAAYPQDNNMNADYEGLEQKFLELEQAKDTSLTIAKQVENQINDLLNGSFEEIEKNLEKIKDTVHEYFEINFDALSFNKFSHIIQDNTCETLHGKAILNNKPIINPTSLYIIEKLNDIVINTAWHLITQLKENHNILISNLVSSILHHAALKQSPMMYYLKNDGEKDIDDTLSLSEMISMLDYAPQKMENFHKNLSDHNLCLEESELKYIQNKFSEIFFANAFLLSNLYIRKQENFEKAKDFFNDCTHIITHSPDNINTLFQYYSLGVLFFKNFLKKFPNHLLLENQYKEFKKLIKNIFAQLSEDKKDKNFSQKYENLKNYLSTLNTSEKKSEISSLFSNLQALETNAYNNTCENYINKMSKFIIVLQTGVGDYEDSLKHINESLEKYIHAGFKLNQEQLKKNFIDFFHTLTQEMLAYSFNHSHILVFQKNRQLPIINKESAFIISTLMNIVIENSWLFLKHMKTKDGQSVFVEYIVNATEQYVKTKHALAAVYLTTEPINPIVCLDEAQEIIDSFKKRQKISGIKINSEQYNIFITRIERLSFDNALEKAAFYIKTEKSYDNSNDYLEKCEKYINKYSEDNERIKKFYKTQQKFLEIYLPKFSQDFLLKEKYKKFKPILDKLFPKEKLKSKKRKNKKANFSHPSPPENYSRPLKENNELASSQDKLPALSSIVKASQNNISLSQKTNLSVFFFHPPRKSYQNNIENLNIQIKDFNQFLKTGNGNEKKILLAYKKTCENLVKFGCQLTSPDLKTAFIAFINTFSENIFLYSFEHVNILKSRKARSFFLNDKSTFINNYLMDILIKMSWYFLSHMKGIDINSVVNNIIRAIERYMEINHSTIKDSYIEKQEAPPPSQVISSSKKKRKDKRNALKAAIAEQKEKVIPQIPTADEHPQGKNENPLTKEQKWQLRKEAYKQRRAIRDQEKFSSEILNSLIEDFALEAIREEYTSAKNSSMNNETANISNDSLLSLTSKEENSTTSILSTDRSLSDLSLESSSIPESASLPNPPPKLLPKCYKNNPTIKAIIDKISLVFQEAACDGYLYGSANYKDCPNDLDILIPDFNSHVNSEKLIDILEKLKKMGCSYTTNDDGSIGYKKDDSPIIVIPITFIDPTSLDNSPLKIELVLWEKNYTEHANILDYTVGASYFNLRTNTTHLIESIKAKEDIERKELNTVSEDTSKVFSEDPSRIFRGIRLVAAEGFHFSEKCENTIKTTFNDINLFENMRPGKLNQQLNSLFSGSSETTLKSMQEFSRLNILDQLSQCVEKWDRKYCNKHVEINSLQSDPEKGLNFAKLACFYNFYNQLIKQYQTYFNFLKHIQSHIVLLDTLISETQAETDEIIRMENTIEIQRLQNEIQTLQTNEKAYFDQIKAFQFHYQLATFQYKKQQIELSHSLKCKKLTQQFKDNIAKIQRELKDTSDKEMIYELQNKVIETRMTYENKLNLENQEYTNSLHLTQTQIDKVTHAIALSLPVFSSFQETQQPLNSGPSHYNYRTYQSFTHFGNSNAQNSLEYVPQKKTRYSRKRENAKLK